MVCWRKCSSSVLWMFCSNCEVSSLLTSRLYFKVKGRCSISEDDIRTEMNNMILVCQFTARDVFQLCLMWSSIIMFRSDRCPCSAEQKYERSIYLLWWEVVVHQHKYWKRLVSWFETEDQICDSHNIPLTISIFWLVNSCIFCFIQTYIKFSLAHF